MPAQASSTLIANDIDLGNAVVYYSPSHFTSFSAAKASTAWRKFGKTKEGTQIDASKELIEFYGGFPAKLEIQYVQSEDVRMSGQLLEINPRNLARVLGGLDITETVKASSPTPTTVSSGSTTTVIEVADATGFAENDEIRVGDSGSYQYGRIASISGTTLTLHEGLSGDVTPTAGHAVAKIDESSFDLGGLSLPAYLGIKLVKTLVGGYGTQTIYIPKAQMISNLSMLFQDNTQSFEGIGVPFEVRAISDDNVESGKTARWEFAQS